MTFFHFLFRWLLEFKQEEIERCLQKPRISLNEDNLIWEPLISKEPQISAKNDEVYNVLFYDEALDPSGLNQSMKNSTPLPGKLKKKRRRRWNKAYNHTPTTKRRKKKITTGEEIGNQRISDEDEDDEEDDEDSRMTFENDTEDDEDSDVYDENYDEDEEEEETIKEDSSIVTNGNVDSAATTSLHHRTRSTVNNHDESSCDKPITIINGHHHHLRNISSSASAAIIAEDSNSSPLFKVRRRKRSTSRSPFKRLKQDSSSLSATTLDKMPISLTNGNHKTINGKLPVRNLNLGGDDETKNIDAGDKDHHNSESLSDSNSDVSNDKNENVTASTLMLMKQQHSSPLRNHHHSPRNLSNGVC